MKGEVIKEVEKKKTDGFVEKRRKRIKVGEEIAKLKPGEVLIIPVGTYAGKIGEKK